VSDPSRPEPAGDPTRELARLRRRLAREKRAREEAEALLMSKSGELYEANRRLAELAESLEQQVDFKAIELLNAQRLARFGTLVWDIRAEHITWSEGVYHVLGLDPEGETLSFERYLSLVHPEDREAIATYIEQSIDDMLELHREYRIEHRVRTPAGETRWVRGYAEAVSRGQGEIEYLIGAVRDVTADKTAAMAAEENRRIIEARVSELEQTRDALAEARDEAQAASRTKSRFLAMMSHEIRTPMNGILGTLHMLEDTSLDASQRRLLETALASGANLRTILNDILDLSKMEAGRLALEEAPLPLLETVEDACRFWRPLAERKGLHFRVELDPQLPRQVRGDAARIRQILDNLVSNAIKFTQRGEVSVRVSVDPEPRDDDGAGVPVRLEVQDTGIGIAREQQGLLFREFSQLGEPGVSGASGTGLGLAISRQLAMLMGGAIGVASAPGEGSCFWLRLPLTPNEAPVARETRRELQPLSELLGRRPRILLAEDVPTNQLIAEHMVRNFDCAVEIASNGLEALEALSERPFDLVLMDISMPEMDGLAATRLIRARGDDLARIPIIGVTAYAMSEDTMRFVAAGMDSCVAKPLERGELHAAMSALLAPGTDLAAPASAADTPIVDAAVLDDLRQHLAPAQIDELLGKLDEDLRSAAERTHAAVTAGDAEDVARAAHAIKGLAGSLGAYPLAASAKLLERHARAGELELVRADEDALQQELEAALDHFATVRRETSST
jgi:PAS domain S-box-containing protein